MSVLEYQKKILDKIKAQKAEVGIQVNSILEIAHSKDKISDLIQIINENNSTDEQKNGAIDMLNAISNFSPVARTMLPEFVDALRGQIEAPDESLRLGAISTLTALKDDVVQERLLEEVTSDKPEEERLMPTASALAMLGRDEKALSSSVLQKIMMEPPTVESRTEAIRQMSPDREACKDLISLMKDDNVPLAARAMIPEMVSEVDPNAFLSAAEEMLNTSGAESELAPWLVKSVASISAPEAAEKVESTKKVVAKLRKKAPASFQFAAAELLDKDDASGT